MNCFPKSQKKFLEIFWWYCFIFLEILLMSGLIDDSWILTFSSAFNILPYVILVELCEENLSSHQSVVGKRIFIAFSDKCGYSLAIYQKSVSDRSYL